MKRSALLFLALLPLLLLQAQPLYTRQDSIRLTQMLLSADTATILGSDVLWFARQLLDIPYGAATLETGGEERLTVTLQALDCTTLVDIVSALTLCHRMNKPSFDDFLHILQTLRYRDGIISDYASRNHYFSSWIIGAEKAGLAYELGPTADAVTPFTATERLNIHYMTSHPDDYPALRHNPTLRAAIRQTEQQLSTIQTYYIPRKALNAPRSLLSIIHDGDIIAMVTRKDGLDVSHLGFAVWMDDGQLHMLNASSLRGRVVLEPRTFVDYLRDQRLCTGIRLIRLKETFAPQPGK